MVIHINWLHILHFAPSFPLSLSFWGPNFPLPHPSKIVFLGHCSPLCVFRLSPCGRPRSRRRRRGRWRGRRWSPWPPPRSSSPGRWRHLQSAPPAPDGHRRPRAGSRPGDDTDHVSGSGDDTFRRLRCHEVGNRVSTWKITHATLELQT